MFTSVLLGHCYRVRKGAPLGKEGWFFLSKDGGVCARILGGGKIRY